jgi:aspartyl-tRNA(Asn)/glutamyl-tRNA(Gln) amidotransferase subunit C
MPQVSPEEVTRLAGLARIQVTPEEAERLSHDLGNILEHVTSLEAAEAAPVSHAAPEHNVFRDDAAEVRIGADTARQAFPDAEGPFMKVPRVF